MNSFNHSSLNSPRGCLFCPFSHSSRPSLLKTLALFSPILSAQYAEACLSLVVSESLLARLPCWMPRQCSARLYTKHQYLSHLFALLHNNNCISEEGWGAVVYINILPPLFYWLGDWEKAAETWILETQGVAPVSRKSFVNVPPIANGYR